MKDYRYEDGVYYIFAEGKEQPFRKDFIDNLCKTYSYNHGSRYTVSQTADKLGVSESLFLDVRDALGIDHHSEPHHPEKFNEMDVEEIIEEENSQEATRKRYKDRRKEEEIRKLKRDARKYRRIEDELTSLHAETVEKIRSEAPNYEVPVVHKGSVSDEGTLTLNLQDLHIGHRAFDDSGDYQGYMDTIKENTKRLLVRGSNAAKLESVHLVVGGDLCDVDNFQGETTRGTPQDTYVNSGTLLRDVQAFMTKIVDLCRQFAEKVVVMGVWGNHDYLMSQSVATYLSAWFRKMDDVEFNIGLGHRRYETYDNHMIVATHGDIKKRQMRKLPQIILGERRKLVASTDTTSVFLGHYHYEELKIDESGFMIYRCPTPKNPSEWADGEGYTASMSGIQGVIMYRGSKDRTELFIES
jgi:hypothetical protein